MFFPIWLFEERGDGSSFEQSRIPYSTIKFDISPHNFKFPDTQADGQTDFQRCTTNNCRLHGQQTLRTIYARTVTRESNTMKFILAIR